MASTAARFAVRVAAPVRASAVRRFTTSRAAKGGDGHNHPIFDPSNFNPVGAPLVGLCFTLGGGLFVTRTAYKSHMRKFKGQ